MLDFSGSCGNEAPPQCGVLYIRSWHIKRFKGCSQGYNKNCNVYEGTRQKLFSGFLPLRGGYPFLGRMILGDGGAGGGTPQFR